MMRPGSILVLFSIALAVAAFPEQATLPKAVQDILAHPVTSAFDGDDVVPETPKPAVKTIPMEAARMKMQMAKSEARMARVAQKLDHDEDQEKQVDDAVLVPDQKTHAAKLAEVPVTKSKPHVNDMDTLRAQELKKNKMAEQAYKAKMDKTQKSLSVRERGFIRKKMITLAVETHQASTLDWKAKEAEAAKRIERKEKKLEEEKMRTLQEKMQEEGVAIALPTKKGPRVAGDPQHSSVSRTQAASASVLLTAAVTAVFTNGAW